jgi:peroxiredoxin
VAFIICSINGEPQNSFPDNLNENTFPTISIEFTVEDLSLRAKVEFAVMMAHDDFGRNRLEPVGRQWHERAMITVGKLTGALLLWQGVWMMCAAPLSQSCYAMKGEMKWTTGTNTSTSTVEITREGGVLKIVQVTDASPTNFNASCFIATPAMAVSFFQYGKDVKGSDRPRGISNNGQVSVSKFRIPEMPQLPPIWLMAVGAEEYRGETNRPRPSIYPQFPFTTLHERTQTIPTTAIDGKWPGGFSEYSERLTNAEGVAYETAFAIKAWTNVNGVSFPSRCAASHSGWNAHFGFICTGIEELRSPIDTHVPFLSMVTDWRPMELKELATGCSYWITNGIVFEDAIAAAKKKLVKFSPARDWTQSHPMRVGTVAPDFTTRDLKGESLSLADLRGKYVLLNFWSTTCGPCIAEIPDLQRTYQAFKDDDRVVMISLALDSSERKVNAFIKEHEMLWRQAMLPGEFDDPIARAFKVTGIPKTLIIGPDGKVAGDGLDLANAIKTSAKTVEK